MDNTQNIPPCIYEDDVLVFIARRQHTTPQELVKNCITTDVSVRCNLEDNEKEIIRGLVELYKERIFEKQ